jgi:hypothetical protein
MSVEITKYASKGYYQGVFTQGPSELLDHKFYVNVLGGKKVGFMFQKTNSLSITTSFNDPNMTVSGNLVESEDLLIESEYKVKIIYDTIVDTFRVKIISYNGVFPTDYSETGPRRSSNDPNPFTLIHKNKALGVLAKIFYWIIVGVILAFIVYNVYILYKSNEDIIVRKYIGE